MSKLPKYIYLFYIVGEVDNKEFYDWLYHDKISISPDGEIAQDVISDDPDEDIFFYAYTTSKKLANEFTEERNPRKIRGIRKSVDEYFTDYSEFEKFEREFRICKLLRDTLTTRSYSKKKDSPVTDISLCITEFEKEFISTSFEGLDDRQYNAFTEMNHIDMIFGCLTNKAKRNLLNAGIIDFIKYIKILYTTTSEDIPGSYMDEFKIFFDYFKELFIGGEAE